MPLVLHTGSSSWAQFHLNVALPTMVGLCLELQRFQSSSPTVPSISRKPAGMG
jgi:hypothetical protein